jgi:hypothetical protein
VNTLIKFACSCGWKEDIGVDVYSGILICGAFTLVCPRCGSLTHIPNVSVALPAKLQPRGIPTLDVDAMDRG